MDMTAPSELKAFLDRLNLKPRKALSQNFLIDGNITNKICSAASLSSDDEVLEIGPGPGALTEKILQSGASLIAIEKDEEMRPGLNRLDSPRFKLIIADFLTFPLKKFLAQRVSPKKKLKVVSNIPYHLTSPILRILLPLESYISSVILMMQEEVARRCIGKAKTKDYSSLSLFTQLHSDPHLLFNVKPTCFYPAPTITSTVLRFDLKPFPSKVEPSFFFSLAHQAFHQRRKMLRRSLSGLCDKKVIESTLQVLGVPPSARPEELSPKTFLSFALRLKDKIKHDAYP